MAEFINRDTFLEQKRAWYCKDCGMRKNSKGKTVYEIGEAPCRACDIGDVLDALEDFPAADVVERKTGKWCADYDGYADGEPVYDMWWCSACGEYFDEWDDRPTWKYCPNCGAKMEEPADA